VLKSLKICWVFVAFCGVWSGTAHADPIAGCNYTFTVDVQYEDRGSVQILKDAHGILSMKVIEDDAIDVLDKITLTSAGGDQAREMMNKEGSFRTFAAQARIFPDDIVRVDEYIAPGTGILLPGDPRGSFFAFYGKDERYLGGFGIYGKTPYVCDSQ
jgi:hypothetical protein